MYNIYTNTGGVLIDSTLYYTLLLLQFYSCYFSFRTFHISSLECSHYIHVHFLLYFYTLIGSSDSLNFYIQVYVCYLTDQVLGEDHMCYEESEVLSFRLLVFLLFLFGRFLDSDILDSLLVSFLYPAVIMCGHYI